MNRKSLVTAISLPKEINELLERLQKKSHQSRSGLLREMIIFYVNSQREKNTNISTGEYLDDNSANKVLKLYYKLISETKTKPTIVVGTAIINKKDHVIIGLRKAKDKYVKDLHWTFPSGKFQSLDFENEVIKTCLRETGLKVRIVQLVHARIYPDSPQKQIRIVVLYYHCKVLGGKQKADGDFKEKKWVPAMEVNRHFTTSVSDEVMNFLGNL